MEGKLFHAHSCSLLRKQLVGYTRTLAIQCFLLPTKVPVSPVHSRREGLVMLTTTVQPRRGVPGLLKTWSLRCVGVLPSFGIVLFEDFLVELRESLMLSGKAVVFIPWQLLLELGEE